MSYICIRIGKPPASGKIHKVLEMTDTWPDYETPEKDNKANIKEEKDGAVDARRRVPPKQFTNKHTLEETIRCIQLCIAGVTEVKGFALKMKHDAITRCGSDDRSLCNQVYKRLNQIQNWDDANLNNIIVEKMATCKISYMIIGEHQMSAMNVHPSDMYYTTKVKIVKNAHIEDTDSPFQSWFASGLFVFFDPGTESYATELSSRLPHCTFVFRSAAAAAIVFPRNCIVDTVNNIVIGRTLTVDRDKIERLETKNRTLVFKTTPESIMMRMLTVLRDDTVAQALSVKISSSFAVTIPGHYMVNADVVALLEYYLDRHDINNKKFLPLYISPLAALIRASLFRDKFLKLGAIRYRQNRAYDEAVTRCENLLCLAKPIQK